MIECLAEELVPLTSMKSLTMASYLEVRDKAAAACNTALLLESEGHIDVAPNAQQLREGTKEVLTEVAKAAVVRAEKLDNLLNTPEGAYYVNSLLTQYDMEVVQDAKRLRNYVTNRLVVESDNMDARIRMKALELLGKISDVGLFTERTEITVNNRSTVDLENSLREKLKRLMGTEDAEDASIVAPPVQIAQPINVAEALDGL